MEVADGLTDYERERLERIRQNQERMRQLELPGLAQDMADLAPKKPSAASTRGLSSKRMRLTPHIPSRKSNRVAGIEADGQEIAYEGRNGAITIFRQDSGRVSAQRIFPEPAPPRDRYPKNDLPFRSNNANPATDRAFLATLRAAASPSKPSSTSARHRKGKVPAAAAPGKAGSAAADMKKLGRLSLAEKDVCKVTKDAVTHLAFMPVTSSLILAAADKRGMIGIWNVDYEKEDGKQETKKERHVVEEAAAGPARGKNNSRTIGKRSTRSASASPALGALALDTNTNDSLEDSKSEEGDEGEDDTTPFDGVLSFNTHYEYISGLKWAGGGALPSLFTCAYDGSVRRLDTQRGEFLLAWGDEEMEYSCFDVTTDGNTAYIGDKDGGMDVIDLREKERVHVNAVLHDRKVNTVHLDPVNGNVMATGSTDQRVRLWDLRKFGGKPKPLATAAHLKTCQAAFLAPDGSQRVVSTSYDNTVRIWDGKKDLAQIVSVKHDCQTGRWILPLRAVWGMKSDCVIVGSMQRSVHMYDANSGYLAARLSSVDHMTAIPPRCCVHPTMEALGAATGSGRVHIFR